MHAINNIDVRQGTILGAVESIFSGTAESFNSTLEIITKGYATFLNKKNPASSHLAIFIDLLEFLSLL